MSDRRSDLNRVVAGITAALGTVSLAWTFYDYSYGLSDMWNGISQTTLYYTHWANALVILVFGAIAFGSERAARSSMIGHVFVMIAILVMHYWILRGLPDFLRSPFRSKVIHGLLPLLIAVYWLIFVDKKCLNWRDPLKWTALPIAYTVYGLLRGALTGEYAYDVGNVNNLGYRKVLTVIGATFVFAVMLGYLLLGLGKLLSGHSRRDIAHPWPSDSINSQS